MSESTKEPTVGSVFGDLGRPPLVPHTLRRSLVRPDSSWHSVQVVDEVTSTNAELTQAAHAGRVSAGAVLLAEYQRQGRGRLDRRWESPPRAGLTLSVLVGPERPVAEWGWLPLIAGLAVVEGIEEATSVRGSLKWPNDILAPDGRKLGGLLAERIDVGGIAHAVIGLGLNVTTTTDELPISTATSLALADGAPLDRQTLTVCILRALDLWLGEWGRGRDPGPAYRECCDSLGRDVRVQRPSAADLVGRALAVDDAGRLVIEDTGGQRTAVSAGDVVHLR